MNDQIKQKIDNDVKNNKVYLYMKGTPSAPQCGFSATAVSILNEYGVNFGSTDVLSDPDIRQGIKEYSDWPTIPQLYVNGEFIGGCDVMSEMHMNGDLKKIIAG